MFNTTEQDLPYVLFYDNGDQVVPTHWHKELELCYSLEGSTRLLINDEMQEIAENDVVLINSGDTHFYFSAKNHKRLVIIFDISIIDGTAKALELRKGINEHLNQNEKTSSSWSESQKDRVRSILDRLAELNQVEVFGRELLIRAYMFELLYLFCSEANRQPEVKKMYIPENKAMIKLQRVFNYVEQNYTQPMTLEEVASEAGFVPSYFARFFKQYTNTTFFEYLTSYRIGKAQYELVSHPEKNISMVAESVGFSSIKTFNRVFMEFVKVTPLQFRKINN